MGKAVKKEVKKITPKVAPKTSVSAAKKTARKRITKSQRNANGTFKKGNAGGGRKPELMSARMQAKIMAAEDPALLQSVLKNLYKIASDPTHPQCTNAADKIIKMVGGYDPTETKDVTQHKHERVYKGLTLEQINKLLEEKK